MTADAARRLAHYQDAVRQEPGDLTNWRGLCRAAEQLHVWGEVNRALDKLITLAEDRGQASRLHAKKGHLLDSTGDRVLARTHFERALQNAPTWTWPYLAIATLDLRERRWSRAIAHANHALETASPDAPERPWLLLVKAVASQRVSVSMGPQSTFFRGLRGPTPSTEDPARTAFLEAQSRLPALRGVTFEDWLADEAAAVSFLGEQAPRPVLDLL
jgi:tetratricopeptide (TPR) repeat protein